MALYEWKDGQIGAPAIQGGKLALRFATSCAVLEQSTMWECPTSQQVMHALCQEADC